MKKQLKLIIEKNSSLLKNSDKSFNALYNIMFTQEGILAEANDGFRIVSYTYREIKERIELVSDAIYRKTGASHSYIGLEMENCIEWIISFWAILRSGNKPYLINCRHPKSLSDSIIKTLGIKYIIALKKSELDADTIIFSDLKGESGFGGDFENEIAFSTSATSLNEVVCFYSGKEFSNQILNVEDVIKYGPEITAGYKGRIKQLAFLPFYHVFGLVAVYFWFTFFGRTVVFLKDYSADTILKTVRKHQVTHVFAVPALWHTIEKEVLKKVKKQGEKAEKKLCKGLKLCTAIQNVFPRFGMNISQWIMRDVTDNVFGRSIKFCINGGSYLRDSALYLFNGLGYSIHNGYGMSEIGITSVEMRNKPVYKNLNSIGRPFSSVEYMIDDNGILNVRGCSICKKMIINGEEHIVDGWFDTGDKMEQKDGYYYIRGRLGDVIIGENGENINPDITEKNFILEDADNFSVLGLPQNGDETVTMIVQINKYLPLHKIEKIMNEAYTVNDKLPITSRVRNFFFTYDAICPPTAVKVGRKWLLRALENNDVKLIPFAEINDKQNDKGEKTVYNTEMYNEIRRIISEVLNIEEEKIEGDSNILIDLGATSIEYFSVLTELSEKFSIDSYSDTDNYRYTLNEFCDYIERHM